MAQRDREFTTWITAAVAPTAESEARKLERIYDRTFDHIRRQAAFASRASAGLVGGGLSPARSLGSQATEAQRLASANLAVARSHQVTERHVRSHGAEVARLERRNAAMVSSLRSSATALQVVQGPLGPMAGRITALSNAMERLTGFRLGIVAVGAAMFSLVSAANRAQEIRQKLSPLYETQEQVNAAFRRTAVIARDTRTALEPIVDLYSRLTLVGRGIGLTPQRIETTTRAAALGARISGGSRQAQQAAITQLAQGIGSNRLGGEELKSILENAPRIAQAIADGLSNTENFGRVTIGMLRSLGAEGELTAERVTRALGRSLHQLEEEAKRLGPTMASSMSAFGTEFTVAVSNLDQALSLTRSVASVIQFAADNMRELVALSLGLASAWAIMKAGPALTQRINDMRTYLRNQRESFEVQKAAALQERSAAGQAVIDLGRRNTALRVQRENIEANIRAQEAEVAMRRRNVAALAPAAALGAGVVTPGAQRAVREHADEVDRLRAAERRLGEENRRLIGVQLAQANTSMGLVAATDREEKAKRRAAVATSRLRTVGGALLTAINPLGIAVGILTIALFELALAESRAERNAKRLEEIQRELAASVDETTGRIREQNAELRRGLLLRSQEAEGLAYEQFSGAAQEAARAALDNLVVGQRPRTIQENMERARRARERGEPAPAAGSGMVPVYLSGRAGQEAAGLLRQLAEGRGRVDDIARRLDQLARINPDNPSLRRAADALTRELPNLTDNWRSILTERARQAELEGRATANDRRILRGDFSGGRIEGRTPQQLQADAEAERRRLREPRYRARTGMERQLEELETRASQLSQRDYIRERAEILNTYDREIEQIERAEGASRRRGEAEAARQERLAEAARERAEQLENLMGDFQDDAPVRQLERVYDRADRAKRQIRDLIGEQVEGLGRFTAAQADERIRQIEASVQRQGRRFLDETMERFEDDTPIRRMRQLATAAREAKRDIDALVGRSIEGYEQGFTRADADRLKSAIDTYVEAERRRPLTEALRSMTQELEVQQLLLAGREAEAAALERAFQLREQMGDLSDEELQLLYESEQQHRRVNDLLEYRQRLVSNLVSVAEDARQAIEGALGQLTRGRPDRAIVQLFRGLMESYFRVQVRGLTERLMEGTDRRITDLVNGRIRVDGAIAHISTGMETAGSAAMDFANRLRAAAAAVDAARADVQPGPGAAAVVTPRSPAGQISIRNPLERMVVGGDSYAQHLARGSSGVDLRARVGTEVRAPFEGTLTWNQTQRGGLQAFVTSLDGRVRFGMAHLNAVMAQGIQGIRVAAGQLIARTGNTGINPRTGRNVDPHGHASLRIDGRSVDPMLFFGRRLVLPQRPGQPAQAAEAVAEPVQRVAAAAGQLSDAMREVKSLVESLPDDSGGTYRAGIAAGVAQGVTPGAARTQFQGVTGLIGELHQAITGPEGIGRTGRSIDRALADLTGQPDVDWRNAIPAASGEAAAQAAEQAQVRQNLSLRELYNRMGADIGRNIDQVLGTRFAERIGGKLGDVLVGAGKGQMASGVARMLGIKQSTMGASVGGAIGQLAAPLLGPLAPFAPFLGGLIGGTIGGLFKKTPKGSTTVSVGEFGQFVTGGTRGSSQALRDAADALGGSVGSGLQQIADALFGEITGSGSVSIGKRKDQFVVDPTGRGRTKGSGVLKFDSEEEAVEAAIKLMIQKGVIGGISAASQNIIQKGKDLQTAIQKAAAIESIPRRLMQIKDPVRFALVELNREFAQLINFLKEGGATAQQFAEAQELYDLERQRAIEQAKNQAAGQIQSFLDDMMGGANSPLNRRTVFANAKEQIDRFTADIMGGKAVDEGKLLEAARNFQDASRGLKGSGEGFFADFYWLADLLKRAKQNVEGGASSEPLPASPFASDPDVQRMIDAYRGTSTAINDQTGVLGGKLDAIFDALVSLRDGAAGRGSSIGLLPSFGGAGRPLMQGLVVSR